MSEGIGNFLWKCSVGLYLLANGVLGLFLRNNTVTGIFDKKSDFDIIFNKLFGRGDMTNALVIIASVVAFVAGVLIILEMLKIQVPMLDTLIFVIAIIWAVFVIVSIIVWVSDGLKAIWPFLQTLAIHLMVFSSLLIASKKFN